MLNATKIYKITARPIQFPICLVIVGIIIPWDYSESSDTLTDAERREKRKFFKEQRTISVTRATYIQYQSPAEVNWFTEKSNYVPSTAVLCRDVIELLHWLVILTTRSRNLCRGSPWHGILHWFALRERNAKEIANTKRWTC